MFNRLPACPYLFSVPCTSLVVALGAVVERLLRRDTWKPRLANGSVFLGTVSTGVMLGGGVMYVLLMKAAAGAPADVLSAMMQPTIPFFIVLNTPLELLVVPAAVFANWQNESRRPRIALAAASYYALRIWTYLAYASNRVEVASRPLSADDLEWFYRSLGVDYRPILVAVVFLAFAASAFIPDQPRREAPQRPATCQES